MSSLSLIPQGALEHRLYHREAGASHPYCCVSYSLGQGIPSRVRWLASGEGSSPEERQLCALSSQRSQQLGKGALAR